MKNIVITADSGVCPLNIEKDLLIPVIINGNNNTTYLDGELTNKEILERTALGEKFKTSSGLGGSYIDTFEKQLDLNNEIIHLSMSYGISSGTEKICNIVMEDFCDEKGNVPISIVNTMQGATGGTLIYELAKDLVKTGLSREKIVKEIESIRSDIYTSFLVPNPEGFIRSGRDSSELKLKERIKARFASVMSMRGYKFRVNFDNCGNLISSGEFRIRRDIFDPILKDVVNENNIENYDPKYIVIGNVNENKVDMQNVYNYIDSFKYFENILRKDLAGAIACYGCDDLCGISVLRKKK